MVASLGLDANHLAKQPDLPGGLFGDATDHRRGQNLTLPRSEEAD